MQVQRILASRQSISASRYLPRINVRVIPLPAFSAQHPATESDRVESRGSIALRESGIRGRWNVPDERTASMSQPARPRGPRMGRRTALTASVAAVTVALVSTGFLMNPAEAATAANTLVVNANQT